MDLTTHFQMLARYNRVANERLYGQCALLDDAEYRRQRPGSFGSIHGLLNHILLGDRRWLGLFESGGRATPRLNQILYDEFTELHAARQQEDARIERFFADRDADFFARPFANQGRDIADTGHVACSHLFNHQTHHRGQVHVMLSQTAVAPPLLDLHRIINP